MTKTTLAVLPDNVTGRSLYTGVYCRVNTRRGFPDNFDIRSRFTNGFERAIRRKPVYHRVLRTDRLLSNRAHAVGNHGR
jgi:hypothetical protein